MKNFNNVFFIFIFMDIINQLSNSLDAQDEKRALKDKVAVVVTPTESKWGSA